MGSLWFALMDFFCRKGLKRGEILKRALEKRTMHNIKRFVKMTMTLLGTTVTLQNFVGSC